MEIIVRTVMARQKAHRSKKQSEPYTCMLHPSCCRAILLTGTPSLSRPYDLYRQVDALRPGLLGSKKDLFAQRYCERKLIPCRAYSGQGRMKWSNSGALSFKPRG